MFSLKKCIFAVKIVFKPMLPTDFNTIKPVLSGHLKIDKTKVLMENGSLMKVESNAECLTCIKQ